MINNFAPVLIPTLNRFDHFKRCIDSLLECELCPETDLYIALDYPLNDSHWEGYNLIQRFIEHIGGFNSVNIIKRQSNFGAHGNIHKAMDFLFEKYETVILTEDDNFFSKDFLVYTNRCLEIYKGDESIFSVCGYNYPVAIPGSYKDEIYSWQGYSAWGVGFWRDKFLKIDWSEEVVQSNVKQFLKNYKKVFEFNGIANIYIPALMHMLINRVIHGDIYICMYQFLNNMCSVFPVVSRVRNIGNDGSGENCILLEDDVYSRQQIYVGSGNYEIPKVISPNIEINEILKKHFRLSNKIKFKCFCKLFLINIGNTR
jgi:hypothetical protein